MSQIMLGALVNDVWATDDYNHSGYGTKLGITKTAASGHPYIMVQNTSGADIPIGAVVTVTQAFAVAAITKALADARHRVGVAANQGRGATTGVAIPSGYYGWVQVAGPPAAGILVLANSAANVKLYTTATAGYLSDVATSQTQIEGVYLSTARGGTNGLAPAMLVTDPSAI